MRRRLVWAFLGIVFLLLATPCTMIVWQNRAMQRPEYAFRHYADQPLPASAEVLEWSDDHGGFHEEGVFRIVV